RPCCAEACSSSSCSSCSSSATSSPNTAATFIWCSRCCSRSHSEEPTLISERISERRGALSDCASSCRSKGAAFSSAPSYSRVANRGSSSGNLSESPGRNSVSPREGEADANDAPLRSTGLACEGDCCRYFEIDSPGKRIGWYPGGGP